MCHHDVDCQYLVEHMDRSHRLSLRGWRAEERSNWSMWPLPTLLDDVVAMMLPWLYLNTFLW